MAFDALAMAFSGVALVAYMSTLTSLGYTATQYALLTSALAVTGKSLKGFSGVIVDALQVAEGCHGVVASAREAPTLRAELGNDFALVTPGVRPAGSGHADQVRVVTPAEAIAAGASHIVVGRPITEAADPAAEARAILGQIST